MAMGAALIDKDGTVHQMAGLLGLVTSYEKRKFHLGYRLARLNHPWLALPLPQHFAVMNFITQQLLISLTNH